MYHPASPSTLDTTNTTEATQCQSTPSNPMYTLCTTHGGWWYSVWFPGHNIQSDSCNVTTPPGMIKISCRLGCFVPPPLLENWLPTPSGPLWFPLQGKVETNAAASISEDPASLHTLSILSPVLQGQHLALTLKREIASKLDWFAVSA